MHYPRQRPAPGRAGYATNPVDPDGEAYLLQNLLPFTREGIARPRPGLVVDVDFGNPIDHLSIHPATEYLIVVENGNLHYINPQDIVGDDTILDSGWPESPDGFFKHCIGIAASGARYWIAPKCPVGANPGATIYRIDAGGAFAQLDADAPSANWVEAYGTFVFATSENRIAWSEPGKCDVWEADAVATLQKLGEMFGMVAVGDNQAILLGRDGNGVWVGGNEDLFEQHFTSNQRVATPLQSAADCAGRLIMLCPGPSLRSYRNAWSPVHLPLLRELEAITDSKQIQAWYDPVQNAYCITDLNQERTYFYDMDRGFWVGWWDKGLVGIAAQHIFGQPFMNRWFGWGSQLCHLDSSVYDDDGTAITIKVQTAPSDAGKPDCLKQITGVFYQGDATGVSIKLRHRLTTDGAWTVTTLGTIDGNKWLRNFAPVTYRERVIEVSCAAGSGVNFKSLLLEEAETGETL